MEECSTQFQFNQHQGPCQILQLVNWHQGRLGDQPCTQLNQAMDKVCISGIFHIRLMTYNMCIDKVCIRGIFQVRLMT